MINWELLKNPLNWIIVTLMLVIAGTAGHLVLTHFGVEPSGPSLDEVPTLPPGEESMKEVAASVLG